MPQIRFLDKSQSFLSIIIPPAISTALLSVNHVNSLVEVVLDLGRPPYAIFTDQELCLTGYWIEYLTMIEALRTSVSMEPGAQKDPLYVYKRRAAEMFDELVSDIRTAFVRNLFNFRLSKQSEAE